MTTLTNPCSLTRFKANLHMIINTELSKHIWHLKDWIQLNLEDLKASRAV